MDWSIVHWDDERREQEVAVVPERKFGDCRSDGNRDDDSVDFDDKAFHDRDLGTSCGDGIGAATAADFLDNETRIDSVHHHIVVVHCDIDSQKEGEPTLVIDSDSVHHHHTVVVHCDADVPWEEEQPTLVLVALVHERSWAAELFELVVHVHERSWAAPSWWKVHHRRDDNYQKAQAQEEDRFQLLELEFAPELEQLV